MNDISKTGELIADKFDLPADAVSNTSKLTVTGRKHILIENHRGIVNYDDTSVTADCGAYRITVNGTELRLKAMNRNDMLLEGSIISISFE